MPDEQEKEETQEEELDPINNAIETEAVVVTENPNLPAVKESSVPSVPPSNMMEMRGNLVRDYHRGSQCLAERLQAEGKNNMEQMVMALVDEVIKETDSLLGNELLATHEGNLRDASVISYKRAEVLEKAIKAVQTKQAFDKEHGVDVEAPAMRTVFRFFMKKVKYVFAQLGYDDEASDTFFRSLGEAMEGWKKELKEDLNELNTLST